MEERITGVMIYYYFVCQRKLWYFIHEISMEAENENVMLGKLLEQGDRRGGHLAGEILFILFKTERRRGIEGKN